MDPDEVNPISDPCSGDEANHPGPAGDRRPNRCPAGGVGTKNPNSTGHIDIVRCLFDFEGPEVADTSKRNQRRGGLQGTEGLKKGAGFSRVNEIEIHTIQKGTIVEGSLQGHPVQLGGKADFKLHPPPQVGTYRALRSPYRLLQGTQVA